MLRFPPIGSPSPPAKRRRDSSKKGCNQVPFTMNRLVGRKWRPFRSPRLAWLVIIFMLQCTNVLGAGVGGSESESNPELQNQPMRRFVEDRVARGHCYEANALERRR